MRMVERVTMERLTLLADLGESGTMGNNPFGLEKFDLVKDLLDCRSALRDARAELAASKDGMRKALEASFREGFFYGDKEHETMKQATECWFESDAYAITLTPPVQSSEVAP